MPVASFSRRLPEQEIETEEDVLPRADVWLQWSRLRRPNRTNSICRGPKNQAIAGRTGRCLAFGHGIGIYIERKQERQLKLLYDKNDLPHSKKLRDERFNWLTDLGAAELSSSAADEEGFLFGYEHGDEKYRKLVEDRPNVRDRPEERQELLRLDEVLKRLAESGVDVPTPKTWVIGVDHELPDDLQFPLFLRTPKSSWKRGGQQSRANNLQELADEMELLRRAFGCLIHLGPSSRRLRKSLP
jgi:hypothetical protein